MVTGRTVAGRWLRFARYLRLGRGVRQGSARGRAIPHQPFGVDKTTMSKCDRYAPENYRHTGIKLNYFCRIGFFINNTNNEFYYITLIQRWHADILSQRKGIEPRPWCLHNIEKYIRMEWQFTLHYNVLLICLLFDF